jgi:thiol-disulfide isomerase/thioredoxin
MAEPVVAIGHPQGFKFTTTDGIISGYHLTKELPAAFRAQIAAREDQQWIQTTAAISSGNSGGPLLNMQSEVIGINTWVAEGENLGFACAAAHVRDIIQRVVEPPSDFASLTGVQDKLRTCVLDFSNKYRWFQRDLAQASSPEEAKELMSEKHPATRCLSEIWPIVTGRPRGPASFDALNTAIQLLSLPDLSEAKSEYYSGLAELTVTELSADRRLGDLLLQMSQSSAPQMLDAMKTIHDGIDSKEGKAFSTFAIAMMQLRQSEGEQLEDVTAESDRQLAVTQARTEQIAPRLQELIDTYSDVRYRDVLLADIAREQLFELQHLSIGSPMLRIEGVDSAGTTFSTDEYAGKVLVLDFWADWCPHCRVMYPLERKLVEEYSGRPFALLGVCCDDPERLAGLVEKKTVTWRNFVDGSNGKINQEWKVKGFPTLYVVDHRGVIRYNGVRDAELEKAVAMLVAEAEGKAPPDAVAASQPAIAESEELQNTWTSRGAKPL